MTTEQMAVVEWSRRTLCALTVMAAYATAGIILSMGIQYWVDVSRDPSHWAIYHAITPAKDRLPLGTQPTWRSHLTRFKHMDAEWPDAMYCRDSEGPFEGAYRHIATSKSAKRRVGPAYVGYDLPIPSAKPDFAVLDGYWTWEGATSKYPGECHLHAEMRFCPSPGVCKSIQVRSGPIVYFDPEKESGGADLSGPTGD